MGASDPNPRKEDLTPAPRAPLAVTEQVPSLTRAAGVRIVGDRFDDLSVRDDPSSDLFQVMKAVEDAETTIKEQLEENNQLKEQLMQKTHELERVRLEAAFRSNPNQVNIESDPNSPVIRNGPSPGPSLTRNPESDPNSPVTRNGPSSGPSLSRSLVVRQNASGNNGISTRLSGEQADSADPSPRVSMPSSRSLSPSRNIKEGDNDSRFNSPSQGLVPVSGINPNQMWKQDLVAKVREHEEEIAQLRRHLADYSVKETQILNEKSILEQRIAYMRRAFDQQQQDLVDAASKALSYRQDIIEENIRLTYVLQAAQQERSTFVSSLLPLLSEYGLQPAVLDAQSIVSNLKILFTHLQEKLIITEEKLKESQYQIMPINTDYSNNNNSNLPPRSPSHAKALVPTNTGSMEIVPQNMYGQSQSPMSSPSAQHRLDWDIVPAHQHHQKAGPSQQESKSQHIVDPRNRFVESRRELSLSFKNLAVTGGLAETSNSDLEDSSVSDKWGPAQNSPNNNISNNSSNSNSNSNVGVGEDNASQPHLPTVMEEPSSSFSEAESDILPGIEGLRISGEPVPGRELQVSGYSIHGTTSCNFEWVRHHEDGSVNYIDGAKQPNYLVSADDVDAYLAIEVQPLDDRKRKGEVVTLFANDRKKITCDTETQDHIKKNLSVGHINFELELAARFMDIWEPTVLSVKRDGWGIKCSGPRGAVAQEKFQQATAINIRLGYPNEFTIRADDEGEDFSLRTIENGMPRDTIVLTLRLFKMMAVEKRKVKKKGLFFK